MITIGITGSIASGKTTASKFISQNRGLFFSADNIVNELYKKKLFKKKIAKILKIKPYSNFKKSLKDKILQNDSYLTNIEKIIHPLVRKEMLLFLKKNKKKKFLFLEIPLLIENKLTKYFDIVIFIKSKRNVRLKRYKLNGGNLKFFTLLNKRQLSDKIKTLKSDHVIVNNSSLAVLKDKLFNIIKQYE